jgi:NTE family protein
MTRSLSPIDLLIRAPQFKRTFISCMLVFCALALMSGCATTFTNAPRNVPVANKQLNAVTLGLKPAVGGETIVALSFSGGGLRAAAFSYGVLDALGAVRERRGKTLLDDVTFITSVSGGSITAAYMGLNGAKGLGNFREQALLRDGEAELRFSLLNPVNLARLLAGGLNDRTNFQTWLEDDVFKRATFAQLYRNQKPVVWINATNAYHRIAFPFHERAFDAICSDLASFPVSEAVAASMAVPLFFAPVVVRTYPDACANTLNDVFANTPTDETAEARRLRAALRRAIADFRNPNAGRYIKLVDGGIMDNLGLVSILQSRVLLGTPYGPIQEEDAIQLSKMLFIVVDAGQGPSGDWTRTLAGPSGIEIASAAVDAAIESNTRMSFDNFVPMIRRWERDIVQYRCGLPEARKAAILAKRPDWVCHDVSFAVTEISFANLGAREEAELSMIPTRLKLPAADIDRLTDAARRAVSENSVIQRFATQ